MTCRLANAANHLVSQSGSLGLSGVPTHMLRHQFATEALDTNPRELANISQVLGHDSVEITLKSSPSARRPGEFGLGLRGAGCEVRGIVADDR
jgi:integrase